MEAMLWSERPSIQVGSGTADGAMVVACGTGIEGCDEWQSGSDIRAECQADPRTTWRGLVVKLDSSGNEVWHRVDSFVEEGEDDGVAAAASEYVSLTSDGRVISIVDQSFGIGLLVLKPEAGGSSDPKPTDDDEGDDNSEGDSASDEPETVGGDEGESAAPESGCSATGSSPLSGLIYSFALLCLWASPTRRRSVVID